MDAETVLMFWLGELDVDGLCFAEKSRRWWQAEPAFDQEVHGRFAGLIESIHDGGLRAWLETPRGRLAYVIALDQFPRNAFRGTPRAFAYDSLALATAEEGLTLGHDRSLRGQERLFLYLPFMHAEDLATQERCLRLFQSFRDESSGALRSGLEQNLRFAEQHRDVIRDFGRFPHRNEILGRPSTASELAFLRQDEVAHWARPRLHAEEL